MSQLIAGTVFLVAGAVVLAGPVLVSRVTSGDNAVARFLRRRPRVIPALQAVCFVGVAVSSLGAGHWVGWMAVVAGVLGVVTSWVQFRSLPARVDDPV